MRRRCRSAHMPARRQERGVRGQNHQLMPHTGPTNAVGWTLYSQRPSAAPLPCCPPSPPPLHAPSDVSHHPGSDNSLLLSSSSGAATGWFLITYRDKERPNSEVRVAPLSDPSQQTVR
jgi:hypothetical protein